MAWGIHAAILGFRYLALGQPTMRRVPQAAQNPRRLQEKATSFSWAQSAQRRRRKPWASTPHSRNASNSSLPKSGNPAPGLKLDLSQKRLKVFLNQLVEDGFFGTPPLVVNGFFPSAR